LEFHLVTSSANISQFSVHYIRRIRDFTKSTRAKDLTSSPGRNDIRSLKCTMVL